MDIQPSYHFFVEGAFMEEASFDHGMDRLRFFSRLTPIPFFLFLFFLFSVGAPAFATTFGPITVAGQVESSDYVVHGRIIGASWVAENRETRRPGTHWKLQIIDQPKGKPLGEEVVIRQPGGEMGEFGYHVAGSATFRDGEEVFVNLRDTSETGIKDVMGLASGKYTVEKNSSGKLQLESGLGMLVYEAPGIPFTPESFGALVKRVAEGKESASDRNIFVNKGQTHEHDPVLEKMTADALRDKSLPPLSLPKIFTATEKTAPETKPVIEESPIPAEEPKGSPWWIFAVFGGLVAFAGFAFFRRR